MDLSLIINFYEKLLDYFLFLNYNKIMFEIHNYSNPFSLGIFLDYIFRHKIITGELPFNSKLPGIKQLANEYYFSERIPVEAYSRLKDAGYIKTIKKGGTRVSLTLDVNAREIYGKNYIYFQNIIAMLYAAGFTKDDIFSCFFNAIESFDSVNSKFLYIEDNVIDLFQGKEELENRLNIKLNCSLLELFQSRELKEEDRIIITSFKNYYKLQSLNPEIEIIPLRTTPNLSEIINFNHIPTYSHIYYITSTDDEKKLILEKFGYLYKKFKNFKIIKINEFKKFKRVNMIITTKRVLNLLNLESNIKVWVLNRFYDDDGINLIKSKIEERAK